jgi:hypothetical protein
MEADRTGIEITEKIVPMGKSLISKEQYKR